MAIRDVGSKPGAGAGAGSAGGLPPGVEKGLGDAGLLAGGKLPREAAQALVQLLGRAGFQAPAGARDLSGQLVAALKQFQQAQKLPTTGQLDAATTQALKNTGVLGGPDAKQGAQQAVQQGAQQAAQQTLKKPGEKDGFERGPPSLLKQGERHRADLVQQSTPDTNFLDALLNKLGPGGPNEGTSATDIKGAAQANDAHAQTVDHKAKVTEAQKGEDAQKKGSTKSSQKEPEMASNQQLDRGTAAGVKVARGLRTESSKTDEQRRRDALSGKEPTELGILDEEADEDALEGTGDDGNQRRRGQGGEGSGASDDGADATGSAGPGEDGRERERGNASSGDEDHADPRRGNASMDDGSGEGAGHYRVPGITEQARAALAKIVKDAAVENRATTYSWDVTFYKPGVYGAGQKAQELVHLVVDRATAFDAVWQKAQANIALLVRRMDADGEAPSLDEIIQAMRQARARDGDNSAAQLRKMMRPMGKA